MSIGRPVTALLLIALAASPEPARADEAPTASAELSIGDRDLATAKTYAPLERVDRRRRASAALVHFMTSYEIAPSWQAAAGALEAQLLLDSVAAASAWYWVASDNADYSEAYLSWQKGALGRVFEGRAAFSFETPPLQSFNIDGVPIPVAGATRPLALDPGEHRVTATSAEGDTHQSAFSVVKEDVGETHFRPLSFKRALRAGEVDPDLPQLGARRPEPEDMGALQIVTIISTVALASGIAVGGGYLLFGEENPRGIDTPEGAAIITTELLLIGGGTVIALISD